MLLGTVLFSKLANYKEGLIQVEFLVPIKSLKFLRNLDNGNEFSDGESYWIVPDEAERELDTFLFQCDGFRQKVCENYVTSSFIFRKVGGPGLRKCQASNC